MIFQDLKRGDVFTMDGQYYEVQLLGERIVVAYLLQPVHNFERTPAGVAVMFADTTLERIPDPDDVVGDKYLTTAFSDLRFDREHRTPEDDARFEDLL